MFGEMKAGKVEHGKANVNVEKVIEKQLKEEEELVKA